MEIKLMRRHKTSPWKILDIFKSITIARRSYTDGSGRKISNFLTERWTL